MAEYLNPRTEDEDELLLRITQADNGQLKAAGLSFDVFYDEKDDLHIGVFPTPDHETAPDSYLAFIPVRMGGHPIPNIKDQIALAMMGLNGDEYHIAGKGRKFIFDKSEQEQASFMARDMNAIPQMAIDIWNKNR